MEKVLKNGCGTLHQGKSNESKAIQLFAYFYYPSHFFMQ